MVLKFQVYTESWNKILPSLSHAFTTHHPNVFTPILSLSEGRAGIAWAPSNKMLFLPLRYKAYFLTSTLILSFLTLSLFGFDFKGLIGTYYVIKRIFIRI
jgi:hypothetical protein